MEFREESKRIKKEFLEEILQSKKDMEERLMKIEANNEHAKK